MASERPKRQGMYVYNITPINLPPTSSLKNTISKGWGTLTKSKTYRERSEREKVVAGRGGGEATELRKPERKSVSAVEGSGESAAVFLQVKVLASDMPGFMQMHAFRCARTSCDGLDKFSSKYMAYNIKKEFDKVYGPAWHCIVGSSFGSFVTHSTGCFLYFSMEKLYILVFKTKVERAVQDQL